MKTKKLMTLARTLAAVGLAAAGVAGNLRGADAAANKLPQLALGANLEALSYYSPDIPLKDLMFQSGGVSVVDAATGKPVEDQLPRGPEGYPIGLPDDRQVRIWCAFHIRTAEGAPPYKSGRYVLLYDGQGKVDVSWDAKNPMASEGRVEFEVPDPKDGIEIWIRTTDPNDPVRNLRIVHEEDEASFEKQPFNEKYLELLQPFSEVRFVWWSSACKKDALYSTEAAVSHTETTVKLPESAPSNNDAFDGAYAMIHPKDSNQYIRVLITGYDGATRTLTLGSPIPVTTAGQPSVGLSRCPETTWAQRAKTGPLNQQSSKGVAWEYQIQLANTLKVEPWFCIPTAVDDDYVEKLAKLIKDTLDPSLKFFVEYSNETWNYGYPGYDWSEAQMRRLGLTGTVIPADAYHGYRAVQIWKIFNRVFGEPDLREQRKKSRIHRVLAVQTAFTERAKSLMDWTMPDGAEPTLGQPVYNYADDLAITLYFTRPDGIGKSYGETLRDYTIDECFDLQKAHIDEMFASQATGDKPGCIRQLAEYAQERGLRLVCYEGGTHLIADQNDEATVAKMITMNRDPRMKGLYDHALTRWAELSAEFGGEEHVNLFNQLSFCGNWGRYGCWGAMESLYQPVDTAYKYKAFLEPGKFKSPNQAAAKTTPAPAKK